MDVIRIDKFAVIDSHLMAQRNKDEIAADDIMSDDETNMFIQWKLRQCSA
jgi:hypothetical protein